MFKKVCGAVMRVNTLLREFKPDAGRIGVTGLDVIDRQGNAGCFTILGGDGLAQVGGECGDAALARQVVADERNAVDYRLGCAAFHAVGLFLDNALLI